MSDALSSTLPENPEVPPSPRVEVTRGSNEFEVPMDEVESEEIEQNIIKKALDFLKEADNFRKDYEEEWLDYYELFMNYRKAIENEEDAWQSNLHIPLTASLIYQIIPRLASAFINPLKSFARVFPSNITSPEDCRKAEKTEKIIQLQFRRMNFARTMVDTLTECAMYGNAFQKVMWRTIRKELKRKVPVDLSQITTSGMRNFTVQRQLITTFDGPYVEPIDLFYFFPDPKSKDEDMNRYVHVVYLSEYELKNLEQNVIEPTDHEEMGDFRQYNTYADDRRGEVEKSSASITGGATNKEFELMEFYEDGVFTFILNRKKIVRREVEPFFGGGHNLIVYKYLPVPNELYAMGLPKLTKDINEDINFLHNGLQDWMTLLLKRPFFADINRLEDPTGDIEIEPFGIIGVTGGENLNNVIKPMDMPAIDPSIPQSMQYMQGLAQNVTGIQDYVMGRGNSGSMGGGDTATGVSIITKQAMNRLEFHTNYLAMTAITSIIHCMIMLNLQNLTAEQTFYITDEQEPVTAGPSDLVTDFDVVPKIDPGQATKEIDRQQFSTAIQMMFSIPPIAAEQNPRKLSERIYKMFDVENPGELMLTPEEKQQNMMMAQQQQQQQMQMQQEAQMQNMQMKEAAKMPPGGAQSPPQTSSPPGGTPPSPPSYGTDEDMTRMVARALIGNGDKNYEG